MSKLWWLVVLVAVVLLVAALVVSPAVAQAPSDLTVNLVSCWDMDETSGDRADSWGSNTLTDVNTVGYTTGLVNNAADFVSANSEYLTVNDTSDLSLGDNSYSVYMLGQIDNKTADHMMVTKWPDNYSPWQEYRLAYSQGSDRWYWHLGSGAVVFANNEGAVSADTWYSLVSWFDADNNQIGISVDGGTADTASETATPYDGNESVRVGSAYASSAYLDGAVDTLAIWKSRVLNSAERSWLVGVGCSDILATEVEPTETPTPSLTPSVTPSSTPMPTATPAPGAGSGGVGGGGPEFYPVLILPLFLMLFESADGRRDYFLYLVAASVLAGWDGVVVASLYWALSAFIRFGFHIFETRALLSPKQLPSDRVG